MLENGNNTCAMHRCIRRAMTTRGSNLSLVDLSMSHVDTNVCRSQQDLVLALENAGVLSKGNDISHAFRRVDRAHFIPAHTGYAEAYVNRPQPLGFGASMAEPEHHAFAVNALSDRLMSGSRVLDMGTGSGWLAAVFALLIGQRGRVVGIDRIDVLVDAARENVSKWYRNLCDDSSACVPEFKVAYDSKLWRKAVGDERFDAIHVGFGLSMEHAEDMVALLRPCGKMLAPIEVVEEGSTGEMWMTSFENDANGTTTTTQLRKLVCQPMTRGAFSRDAETVVGRHERIKQVEAKLIEWKQRFAATHGCAPSRDDLVHDDVARALFAEFTKLRSRNWD